MTLESLVLDHSQDDQEVANNDGDDNQEPDDKQNDRLNGGVGAGSEYLGEVGHDRGVSDGVTGRGGSDQVNNVTSE